MNGIKIDFSKIPGVLPYDENVFTMRETIYNKLIDSVMAFIDEVYDKVDTKAKLGEINKRSIKSENIFNNSLLMIYKGVEIPLLDKTRIILLGNTYIPIFQMVDMPIHFQKDGRFLVIKNNIRNSYLKLSGVESNVFYKGGIIPLLPYLLYIYEDVRSMLIDLGYEILDIESLDFEADEFYIIPEYYTQSFIAVKKCESGSWKDYFLSPYDKQFLDVHRKICDNLIDRSNANLLPTVTEEDMFAEVESTENSEEDLENIFENQIAKEEMTEEEIEEDLPTSNIKGNTNEAELLAIKKDKEIVSKICSIIQTYHLSTRTGKKILSKMYLETSLYKFTCKDITMNNISIFGLITESIKNNDSLPGHYNISDASQKLLRLGEWFGLKISSTRTYPEQTIITDVAKVEERLVYETCVNPYSELMMMARVNIFGKGGLPREACSPDIRNLSPSYYGIFDPISSPSGGNIGISIHLVPEVNTPNLNEASKVQVTNNIFNVLDELQYKDSTNEGDGYYS